MGPSVPGIALLVAGLRGEVVGLEWDAWGEQGWGKARVEGEGKHWDEGT